MHAELKWLAQRLRETAVTDILPRWHQIRAECKADGSLVTATDLAVQRHLTDALATAFPDIPLLGEEMSATEQESRIAAVDRRVWVLDPLDGTSNYACGFPGFSISLARIEQGQVVLGAILDPVRDECFTAARGQGAFLNGKPIHTFAPSAALGDCLAMIDFKRLPPASLATLFRPGGFRSQRNLGSVALDWCWLASGRFQLYLHGGQRLWDYAAGRLIADEAGVAWRQYRQPGLRPTDGLTLEPRLAIAAANDVLLDRWLDFVDLPRLETGCVPGLHQHDAV